jgi:myosin-crossreactive antigen
MEAVYGLLRLDKPVIPVSPTWFDIRHLAASAKAILEVDTFHLMDLLKVFLPAVVHPHELVEVVNRIPMPTDVRPGT